MKFFGRLSNRTKDCILRFAIFFSFLAMFTMAISLVFNYLVPGANLEKNVSSPALSLFGDDDGDDDEIVPDVDEAPESEKDRLFREEGTKDLIEIETEEKPTSTEDFAGAPSDVPIEALSRPETEVDEESETESVEAPETEVVETEVAENETPETEAPETEASELIETEVAETEIIETEAPETEVVETEVPESETEPEKRIEDYPYDEDKAVALAQLMWAEARGCSKREQSLVAWTVLNRVDVGYDGMGDFWSILTAPSQFAYYPGNPYEEYELRIAIDVLQRYAAEKDGVEDSGRTLPKGYLYFHGDSNHEHNWFSPDGSTDELWFNLGDPYENWTP